MSNYKQWVDSLESVGIPPITLDTCYKILAIAHSCAIEEFVFHNKLSADIAYAQRRCGLYGAGIPTPETKKWLRKYVREMEEAPSIEDDNTQWAVQYPQWAVDIMKQRYGITLPKQRIA